MADERQSIDNEDDELLLTDKVEPGDEDEQRQSDEDEDQDSNVNDQDEEEVDVLTFGEADGEDQEGDSGLVKHLRSAIKDRDRELAELRQTAKPEPIEVGERPKLEDFDYDEDKHAEALEAWADRKAAAKAQADSSDEARKRELEAWAKELQKVEQQKSELPFDDADDAFDTVRATLNTVQQAVIVKASDNAARVIYALAKHPDRLAELAAVTDPLKLAAKVAKLEGQLKVVKRKRVIPPEKIQRGSGRVSGPGKDKTLEKLERDAERTGDRTELIRYRKKLAAADKK